MKVAVFFSVVLGVAALTLVPASATQTTWDGKTYFWGACTAGAGRAGYINFFRNVPGDPASELGQSCLLNWTDSRDSNLTNTADNYLTDIYNNTRTVGRPAGLAPRTHMVTHQFQTVTTSIRLYYGTNCDGLYRVLPHGQFLPYGATDTMGMMSFRGMTPTGTYPTCP